MTLVRINDGALLDILVGDLQQRPDVVLSITGPNTIEVSLLGSYDAGSMRLALELRLRAWEAAQRAQGHDVRLEMT